jgi:hypothetical protein
VPLTAWLFANYALGHGLYRITPKDLERALGLHNKEAKYQALRTLMRNGLIKPIGNGLYDVNVEMAEFTARRIPHPPGRRVYSNQWLRENLPEWRTAERRYRQWLSAVMYASQGTSPPIADFAQFPIVYLRMPSGHCVPTVLVAGLYIIATRSLARRTVVYCVDVGPVTLCSPTLPQLFRYLSPPCPEPYCRPVVPYPTPCEPKVDGLVADYGGRLIPLSGLPHGARKYELGVVFRPRKSPVPYAYDLFDIEVSRRGGHPPHLRIVPRQGLVKGYIGNDPYQVCQAANALADYALAYALSQYQALAGYGMSLTGLTVRGLMARSEEVIAQAYYRRRRPEASPGLPPPEVYLRNVMVEVSKYDRQSRRWRREQVTLDRDGPITCEDLRTYIARQASRGRVKVLFFELWLFLPDSDGSLSKDLAVEYDYIYYNSRKDRPGTVRLEARPFKAVTARVGPQDIAVHLYAKAHRIATAIKVAMLARHRTALP